MGLSRMTLRAGGYPIRRPEEMQNCSGRAHLWPCKSS